MEAVGQLGFASRVAWEKEITEWCSERWRRTRWKRSRIGMNLQPGYSSSQPSRPWRSESSTGGNLMAEVDAKTISADRRWSRWSHRIFSFRVTQDSAWLLISIRQASDIPADNRPPPGSRSRRADETTEARGRRANVAVRSSHTNNQQLTEHGVGPFRLGRLRPRATTTADLIIYGRTPRSLRMWSPGRQGRNPGLFPGSVAVDRLTIEGEERRERQRTPHHPGPQEISQGLRGLAEQALATPKRLGGKNIQQTTVGRADGPGRTSAWTDEGAGPIR